MPPFRQPGTIRTDHHFDVPLNHADPGGPRITVFAREVVAIENAARTAGDLPWLCFSMAVPAGLVRGRQDATTGSTGPCGTTAFSCLISAAPDGPPQPPG
jgi:hypothetical protein